MYRYIQCLTWLYIEVKFMHDQGNTVVEAFCEYTSINLDRKYAEMVACDNHCQSEAHNCLCSYYKTTPYQCIIFPVPSAVIQH